MVSNDIIKWDFEAVDIADYKLTFVFTAENKLLHTIFNKAKEKLLRRKIDVRGANPEVIDKFPVPQQYLNLVNTIISKQIKKVSAEVAEDKIFILTNYVESAYFVRNKSRDWNINITVVGQYANKN